jgi:RHS repeat-associated protein
MFLNPLLKADLVNRTFLLGTIRTLSFGGDRVAQTVDGVLGETVNYTYDMWNRLSSATATNGNWGEAYTYDNFGNLTGKTPTVGSAPSMNVGAGPATNQTMGGSYDANGNWVGGVPYYPNTWDVENRLVATANTTQATNYSYDPWGRRMWEEIPGQRDSQNNQLTNTTCEIYFYGVTGQKLETYSCSYTGGGFVSSLEGINVYFGRKLLQSKGAWVVTDKLGTVRANASLGAMNYFPFGEERTSTANDVEKFGTYTRDGVGQDYAQQRYYNSSVGAFWTPDPGGIKTARSSDPTSWNRYAYVSGDPANHSDPTGMEQDLCGPDWQSDPSLEGPCCDPGDQLLGAPIDPACYTGGGDGAAPAASSAAADPSCSDWGCMPAALARAIQALSSQSCMDLFGNATTRAGAFNPVTVLESLFSSPAGGSFGSTSFQNKGPTWGVAKTSPVITKSPFNLGKKVNVTINSYTGTNGTYWNDGNTNENASTLLHELGHVFNFLRGSGGFAVSNITELKNPYAFDQAIQQNCIN